MASSSRVRVAVLGSGAGTNARALIEYDRNNDASYRVELVVASRPDAGIAEVARQLSVPLCILPSSDWEGALASAMHDNRIAILSLAGFMRKIPMQVIRDLGGRVVNIHPALLPNYGGKGMYGIRVHSAVLAAGEAVSGATVHLVTEEYDEGAVISQATVSVFSGDSPEDLQERIKHLEHFLYPRALDSYAERVHNGVSDLL